ncbi:MAG TPA: MlaD family protein [Gemmatimonadales bacterium]|nr:MlaD family protein [Gemmatimonadales bacterium]
MRTRTADALVGLLVVGAVLVILVAIVVTRGWTERRIILYMLSPTVQDLKQDTPVYLQGLAIGEVASISPQADTVLNTRPEFLVALRLRERYANGVPIRLPAGTKGTISSSGLIGAASIALELPRVPSGRTLTPGDTIRGEALQGWSEGLKDVIDTLKTQVSDILHETRTLIATVNRTASTAQTELASTGPELRSTLASTRQVLNRLEPMIEQTRRTLASTDTTVTSLQDSLTALLGDTRKLVSHADTLTMSIAQTTHDVSPDVRRTLKNVYVMSAKLDYFIDQVSRRPHRLFTGIRPLPRDSIPDSGP